ncbi:MAG: prolyl oligopeptidase family serine peptidase [Bryobacteraceae bacterium]
MILIFALVGIAQTPAKRPMHHRDYDPWKSISGQVLSRDGKFLAYALFPEEGDGEIVVRNLATGKEARENAGVMPPAPENQDPEAAPEAPGARGPRPAFTSDGKFLISTAFAKKADTDQAKKDKKPAGEMPKSSLLIFDLTTMTATRVADVASFQVPENGASLLAYLKNPKAAATPAGSTENDAVDQDQGRGGRGGGRGARGSKYGSDMVVLDLRVGKERRFEDVSEYSMSKDGKTLAYTVGSKKEESNGAYAVAPGTEQAPVALLAGKGRYSKLTWDFAQKEMAFLSDRDDAAAKPPKYKVYLWDRKAGAATALVSDATPGFKTGYAIFERGPVSFSRDGSRLFLSAAPVETVMAAESEAPAPSTAAPGPNEEKVIADLWRWNDDYIQPMQKVRAAQERARSYRAVVHLADKKFVQLADPTMIGLTPDDDGRWAIGMDDRTMRRMVDYDGNYNDVYLVDTMTGARKLLLAKVKGGGGRGGGMQFSPDGKYLLAFKDKQWWSIRTPDGAMTDLTGKTGAVFFNEEHDTPDTPPAYGSAGWTKDGKWALVYDEFDLWGFSADGLVMKKLTDGRASHVQFRVARLDADDSEEERGIDPAKPLLLRAENTDTRDTGFYSLASLDHGTPQKLLMGPKNYRALGKAKDADVVMVTATTFHDQPDIQITDTTFGAMKKVTDANPQQAGILWGTGELIKYRTDDGVELQAALYKPENFNPQKKYPMMVYLYERLSQNVNSFVRPAPGHSINIAYYVSNGYLVITPDIIYTTGHPGQSALKCVLPAIEAVVEKGFVNRNAIGIQGHSWGGYQTAYLLTQTNIFHAAEAGAPVVDMISAYNGIRWGSGLPRQFQYEQSQSRIGGTLWEEPLKFIENSPVFQLDRVKTPVMILQNDADDAVPWYQGIEFFLSLRRLGKEAYMFNYNGEPHHLNRRPNQKDYTLRMQEFFDYELKDGPKPAWMEKGIPYIEREQEKEKHNAVYGEK